MNTAQWLFEYHALCMKDEEEAEVTKIMFKAGVDTLKELLVMLLGLKPIRYAGGEEANNDSAIVPLSMMCGNPHIMGHIMETAEAEANADHAAESDDFDALSEQIMHASRPGGPAEGEGDMTPIFAEPLNPVPLDKNIDYQNMLRSLGIKPRSTPEEALAIKRRPGVLLDD